MENPVREAVNAAVVSDRVVGSSLLTAHSCSVNLFEPKPLHTTFILQQIAVGLAQCYDLMGPV